MPDLHSQLAALASAFADQVLSALRAASIDELVSEMHGGSAPRAHPAKPAAAGGRRPARGGAGSAPEAGARTSKASTRVGPAGHLARRSPEQIAKTLGDIVALLKSSKGGLRSEQIRDALGLDKREMPRVLQLGLTEKKLRAKGVKRSTTYSVA